MDGSIIVTDGGGYSCDRRPFLSGDAFHQAKTCVLLSCVIDGCCSVDSVLIELEFVSGRRV